MSETTLGDLKLVGPEDFDHRIWNGPQRMMAAIRANTKTVMRFGGHDAQNQWYADLEEAFGQEDATAIVQRAMGEIDADMRREAP